ncbi:hypothetical protein NDU88_012393 [Pleurodeles waltl]|uniref:Uncharacterized protein n=1 Tax=Pleurodeles waltl TaxID=8319 RepID=A0AAV7R4C4_PLEWA|nr:hypothetical protein NDU88_012393 [Pleurodeles waltl]
MAARGVRARRRSAGPRCHGNCGRRARICGAALRGNYAPSVEASELLQTLGELLTVVHAHPKSPPPPAAPVIITGYLNIKRHSSGVQTNARWLQQPPRERSGEHLGAERSLRMYPRRAWALRSVFYPALPSLLLETLQHHPFTSS